jgi:glycosyltransferase involved in cell wall biosynthesis
MNIAIDVTPILPGGECGGATQLVLELLRGLGKKAASDKFILLTAHYNEEIFRQFDSLGMRRVCILRGSSQKHLSFSWRVFNRLKRMLVSHSQRGLLRRNGVSVLFCPMTAPSYHEVGIPTVSIVYDLQHLYYPSFFSQQELACRNNFYGELVKKTDYIICISSFTRKTVIEKLGIPPGKISVIPVCVHSRMSVPSSELAESIFTKFNLNAEKYCIYPANLWPHKNHKMLLVAFNMFTKRYPTHNLHLVLTGAELKRDGIIKKAVEQMGLADRVHFLGYLKEEELSAIWHRSLFLIFPSLFEGFGIPLIEAMRYRKPIIASNVTSIPEVAGDAAIYFDPKKPDELVSSLCKIMEDESLCRLLVVKGHEQLKHYDFNRMIDEYIRVIHQAGETGCDESKKS